MFKTTWLKNKEVKRNWYVIDATDKVVGRVANKVASLIMGKGKVERVPNMDCGDFVIVLNSDKIQLTREKSTKKFYSSYSGFPGGQKNIRFDEMMKKDSRYVVQHAVKLMLPQTKLLDQMMNRLFVYKGSEHKHQAQQPVEIKL